MQTIAIEGKLRKETGKGATKAIRRSGEIPCVMYGSEQNIHFSVPQAAVRSIVYTPVFYKIALNVDGQTYVSILKDIQFDPVTDAIEHIDFHMLIPGNKMFCEIPVRTVGTSPGVKEGGKLMIKVRKLKVKATPEQLREAIDIDISGLGLGQSFRVRDLGDIGLEILNSPAIPLATIEIPRSLRSAAAQKDTEGKKK
jgi:large subunit ribosomal protein L25